MKRLHLTLLLVGLVYVDAMAYTDHRNHRIDSLEALLRATPSSDHATRMNAYKELMWGYLQTDGTKATHYARKALDLSYKESWLNSRADALRLLGLVAYGSGNYAKSLKYYKQALAVTDSMRHSKRYNEKDIDDNLSSLYGSIGNLYNIQDSLHLAIAYYQKALPIFEKYGWLESTSILYHNIGELYGDMGNAPEALHNYKASITAAIKSGDSLQIAMSNKGLSKVYISLGEYEHAAQTARDAYAYYRHHAVEESEDYVTTLASLARIAMKGEHDISLAESYTQEALSYISEEMMANNKADIYNLACELAMERKQWQKALDYARLALYADSVDTYDDLGTYVYLAQIYAELGDKERVKEYVAHIFNGMEKISTDHYQSGLSQMRVLYETEKKQTAIEQLTRQRRWFMIGGTLVVLILLLALLLFIMMWRAVRQSKRHALVKAKLDGELAERVRIARDLHDRLGGTLTALRLTLSGSPSEIAEIPSPLELTDSAIREMRNVAHHLLPDSLRRYGLQTALSDYCNTMQNVSFRFTGNLQHVPNEEAIYCIVYELVNNAVKSADAKHIDVQITTDNRLTTINVCDDGKGLVLSREQEKGGCGMTNIRERIKAIGGCIDINTLPNKGTEINIKLQNTGTTSVP